MKYSSQKFVLHPFTANIISFKTNDSHEHLNVSFPYLFYNPNSKLNLDVLDGTVDLYFGFNGHLSASIRHLSLQPRQQKVVDFNFFTHNPNFRLDSYAEYFLATNRHYLRLTVKVRARVHFMHIPISFYGFSEQTCRLKVEGQFFLPDLFL